MKKVTVTTKLIGEYLRLIDNLSEGLEESSELKQALEVCSYALSYFPIMGKTKELADFLEEVQGDLTDEQRRHLEEMGIEP